MAQSVSKQLKNTSKIKIFKTYGTAMLKYLDYEVEFVVLFYHFVESAYVWVLKACVPNNSSGACVREIFIQRY